MNPVQETIAAAEAVLQAEAQLKKEVSPQEIYRRNIVTMPPRQMRGHLRRKARKSGSMIDGAWGIILSTIFENTTHARVGGKLEFYLR